MAPQIFTCVQSNFHWTFSKNYQTWFSQTEAQRRRISLNAGKLKPDSSLRKLKRFKSDSRKGHESAKGSIVLITLLRRSRHKQQQLSRMKRLNKKVFPCCKCRWCLRTSHLMNPTGYCLPVPEQNCVFNQSTVEKSSNERPVWHQLYNFRPHFPLRPLNLTAIWRLACLNHSQLSKNKPLGCILGTGVWRRTQHTPALDFVLVTITYCDSSYLQMILPRIIWNTVGVYNILQLKLKGEAKIETPPHEGAQTRNSLFDGYIFQWCNDGVSPEGFKSSPSFMIRGRVVAHVVSSLCASAYDTESLRTQTRSHIFGKNET